MVPMDWYASQKLWDQGMTRCTSSIMQNPNLSLKILDSSIALKADVLILSGAQLMISYNLSGRIQDQERTQHPGACGALTYLQGVTQGERVPAECLSRSVIMYKSKYIHGGTLPE